MKDLVSILSKEQLIDLWEDYPGIYELAKYLEVSPKTVRRALKLYDIYTKSLLPIVNIL